jgi:hypothetical protein
MVPDYCPFISHNLLELFLSLEHSINTISNFYDNKYQSLLKREGEICRKFGLTLVRGEPCINKPLGYY